ncbi:MAG: hypothetical protein MAG453_00595 [Calditrichaeota bacterium]|nr:hypothetical protein [Calditrichota bacterium]
MKSYRQTLVHIVFATRHRQPVLSKENRERLYRYIWGICRQKECRLHRIGGYDEHVHILISLHPSISLANFVQLIKGRSSHWITDESVFPGFVRWQRGYSAFNVCYKERSRVVEYIKNQEEHHHSVSFLEEYRDLLEDAGFEMDERYLP